VEYTVLAILANDVIILISSCLTQRSPASMELKVLRLSKGASGIEVRWIDGLGELPFNT
jgi:hypothetical protein